MRARLRLCSDAELPPPGDMAGFAVPGLAFPVLLVNLDGELIATSSICPHEDVSLLGGDLDGTCLTCPGHGYAFDLQSGRCAHDPALRLRRFPLARAGGEVFIDIDLLGAGE